MKSGNTYQAQCDAVYFYHDHPFAVIDCFEEQLVFVLFSFFYYSSYRV